MSSQTAKAFIDVALADKMPLPRSCRVELASSWAHPITIAWKRDARTQRVGVRLQPGKTVNVPLEYAMAEFGMFNIPQLIEEETDVRRKQKLAEQYVESIARSILRWGDYPRLAHYAAGMTYEAIGPARFPDITVTIIDPQGEIEYEPIRLRDLYDLGEYIDVEDEVNPRSARALKKRRDQEEAAAKKATTEGSDVAALRDQVSTLTGTINTILALIAPDKLSEILGKVGAMPAGAAQASVEDDDPAMKPEVDGGAVGVAAATGRGAMSPEEIASRKVNRR